MRKDGKVGSACLKWSFGYMVTQNGTSKLHEAKGLL